MRVHNWKMAGVLLLAGAALAIADTPQTEPAVASEMQPSTESAATNPTTQSARSPQSFLTQEQLAEDYRAGKYAEILREIGRIRSVSSVVARYDWFQLDVLRAESYLQLRNVRMAITAFTLAAHDAPDPDHQALMRATALLVESSISLKYVSQYADKQGDPWPGVGERHAAVVFDLLALAQRSAALRALYTDQSFITSAAVEWAKRASSMADFRDVRLDLTHLAIAERAVTGKEESTQKLRKQTAMEIDATIRASLAGLTKRAQAIQDKAREPIGVTAPFAGSQGTTNSQTIRPRGLDDGAVRELHQMEETADAVDKHTSGFAEELQVDKTVFSESVRNALGLKKLVRDIFATTPSVQ